MTTVGFLGLGFRAPASQGKHTVEAASRQLANARERVAEIRMAQVYQSEALDPWVCVGTQVDLPVDLSGGFGVQRSLATVTHQTVGLRRSTGAR